MNTEQLLPLVRLFQLASPSLPVGAYSFSQGLEWAVETGAVHDPDSAQRWIGEVLKHSLKALDGPVLVRLCHAWESRDLEQVEYWNSVILASRESAELLTEDRHLGIALVKLIEGLDSRWSQDFPGSEYAFVTPFAYLCNQWRIPATMAVSGYLWGWLENQALGAIKLVPLGQVAGQKIIYRLAAGIPDHVQDILQIQDDQIGGSLPYLAIASSLHETQYTRLFRS